MLTWINYYKYFSNLSDGKTRNILDVAPNDPMSFLYHLEKFGANAGVQTTINGNHFSIKINKV